VTPANPFGSQARCLTRSATSCAFFHNPDEEYRVLLPFIKEGFERGEKAFHIVDPKLRGEHRLRLGSAGIDVETAETSGQFELRKLG